MEKTNKKPTHLIEESRIKLDEIAFSGIYHLNQKDTFWRYPPNLNMVAKVQFLS